MASINIKSNYDKVMKELPYQCFVYHKVMIDMVLDNAPFDDEHELDDKYVDIRSKLYHYYDERKYEIYDDLDDDENIEEDLDDQFEIAYDYYDNTLRKFYEGGKIRLGELAKLLYQDFDKGTFGITSF
jgi:hypothetical protein